MEKILKKTIELLEDGSPVVWTVVAENKGSTPRDVGSRMLIAPSGVTEGSVGGGRLEGEVMARGHQLLLEPGVDLLSITMTGKEVTESNMICGGRVNVFLETLTSNDLAFVKQLEKTVAGRTEFLLVTLIDRHDVSSGERHLLVEKGSDTVGEKKLSALVDSEIEAAVKACSHPVLVHSESSERGAFVEPLMPTDRLFLFGGGHVALEIAWLGRKTDFQIHVWDDRHEFVNPERFPMAEQLFNDSPEHVISSIDFGPNDYVVIVTRGHQHDLAILRQVISKTPRYIGMIGSRRKRTMIFDQLTKEGVLPERLEQVYAPIGLDIQAQTPAELAVAIIGELIQVRAENMEK